MARLKSFLYCEGVNIEQTPNGPKHNLIGPLQTLSPMFIPGMFSFSIFMSISGKEVCEPCTFRVAFKKVDMDEYILDTGNQSLPGIEVEGNIPEDSHGFMINMDLKNVVIKSEGLYISEIYLNNIKIGESDIYAKAAEKNE